MHDTKAVSDAKEKVKHNERQKQTSHLQRDDSERKNERGEGGEGERERGENTNKIRRKCRQTFGDDWVDSTGRILS